MSDSRVEIKDQFILKLEGFLHGQSTSDLSEAGLLGTTAMEKGIGERELMKIYYEVLSLISSDFKMKDQGRLFRLSMDFLSECLSPYEERNRNHEELILRMNRQNQKLRKELDERKRNEKKLTDKKEYYQKLIENGLDIITVLNIDGTIRYLSPSLKRVMGYEPDELIGSNILDFIHPDCKRTFRSHFSCLDHTKNRMDLSEFRFRSRDGSWRYLESIANFVSENSKKPYIIVNSRDITRRVIAREKLQKHKQQLSTAQQIAKLGSWEWDFKNDSLRWSRELSKIYGMKHEKAPSSVKDDPQLIHPDDFDIAKRAMQKALSRTGEIDFEQRIIRQDGVERTLHVRGEVVYDNSQRPVKMIGTGQDITELKTVEKKLQASSELLRQLSARQSRIREDERIRISREIHDELGQMLTVLKMELFLLKEMAAEEKKNSFALHCVGEIGKAIERFDTIINSVQRITTELRPEVLDTLGLNEAVEWQCRVFEAESGLHLSFGSVIESGEPIDDERSTAIFRILQETLSNIRDHAEATKVEVQLKRDDQYVVLMVKDNGRGISREKIRSPESLGIIGMYERSQFLGGDIIFRGNREEGTTVILKIPL